MTPQTLFPGTEGGSVCVGLGAWKG